MWTVTEVKRFLRAGMGLCQGQTCQRQVRAIIARELGARPTGAGLCHRPGAHAPGGNGEYAREVDET